MQPERQIALALSIFLLMLPLVGAYTAATDVSTIRMTSCSRGQVYAYAENTEGADATLSVNAYFGNYIYGSVTCPIQPLPAYQSRGTKINVYSPGCFKGDEDVIIQFNICRNATFSTCTQMTKTVRMIVEPCTACTSYIEQHLPAVDNYAPAASTCTGAGCSQPLVSNVYFEQAYEPSDITADISFASEHYELDAGSSLQTDIKIENRGVPVTLDLSLEGDAAELGAALQDYSVGLGDSESKVIGLSVNPGSSTSGERCLDVVATRRGVEVERRTACFSVFEATTATVNGPASAGSGECGKDATYQISVQNTGAFANTFTFTSNNDAVRIAPSKVTVQAGDSESTTVTVNASKLGFAQDVGVTVTGSRLAGADNKPFSETVVTSVRASECADRNVISSETHTFTATERFSNPSNQTIYGVTGTIEGLPTGFVVEQKEGPQDVAPGSSINITLSVTAPADAQGEAAGVLVLRSQNGKIVGQRAITLNTVSGGITGFFTKTVGSNLSYIIAMLIGAAIVVLLYAREEIGQKVSAAMAPKADNAGQPNKKDAASTNAKEKAKDADKEAGDSATINS